MIRLLLLLATVTLQSRTFAHLIPANDAERLQENILDASYQEKSSNKNERDFDMGGHNDKRDVNRMLHSTSSSTYFWLKGIGFAGCIVPYDKIVSDGNSLELGSCGHSADMWEEEAVGIKKIFKTRSNMTCLQAGTVDLEWMRIKTCNRSEPLQLFQFDGVSGELFVTTTVGDYCPTYQGETANMGDTIVSRNCSSIATGEGWKKRFTKTHNHKPHHKKSKKGKTGKKRKKNKNIMRHTHKHSHTVKKKKAHKANKKKKAHKANKKKKAHSANKKKAQKKKAPKKKSQKKKKKMKKKKYL
jgi:hypothetical protein